MKRVVFLCAGMAVAGCGQTPSDNASNDTIPAVTTVPADAPKPIVMETVPLAVDAESVVEQASSVLAAANWTKKQCDLTLAGGSKELVVTTGGSASFQGFFIDPVDRPAGQFDIVLKGESKNYRIPVKTGWDRTDVATYFKIPALANSGFDATVALASVPSGKYEVDFMVNRDGKDFFCESGKILSVQ